MSRFLRTFIADTAGATAIEYGLIAALIAVVIMTAVSQVGTAMVGRYNNVANATK